MDARERGEVAEMVLSRSGQAAFAVSALLVQAITAMPVLAAEAAPLADTVLSEATAIGVDASVPPGDEDQAGSQSDDDVRSLDRSDRHDRTPQPFAIEMPGATKPQTGLGPFMLPASYDVPGAGQSATNLVFGVTLNGVGNFASVQP